MLCIYILICVGCFYLSFIKYNKIINILSLYIFIWLLNVGLYELKLLEFNTLKFSTWLILCCNIIVFSAGCLAHKNNKKSLVSSLNIDERLLYKLIIFSCIVSSIGIIPNLFMLFERYGFNILGATAYIYADNLNQVGINTIPYLGSLSLFAVLLSSIFFVNFGFKFFLIIPYLLVILDILPSGSRGNLVLALVLTVIPVIFCNDSLKININTKKTKSIGILLSVLLVMFYSVLTYNRRPDTAKMPYVSETMVLIDSYIPIAHKTYFYFTSPVGVLNEFVNEPRFIFGINTFSVERNFLRKFGINVKYEHVQPAYNIPMKTNVGTWLKDFYEDFTMFGMFVLLFLIAYFFDKIFLMINRNILYQIIFNISSMLIYLSWFYFYLRQGNVTIIVCCIILLFVFLYFKNRIGSKSNNTK